MIDEVKEWEEELIMFHQKYYHGTSTALNIKRSIKPANETGVLREDFRTTDRNFVFVTSSYWSAEKYAKKACEKYGGEPVIYEVIPNWDTLNHRMDFEYTTDEATIVNILGIDSSK